MKQVEHPSQTSSAVSVGVVAYITPQSRPAQYSAAHARTSFQSHSLWNHLDGATQDQGLPTYKYTSYPGPQGSHICPKSLFPCGPRPSISKIVHGCFGRALCIVIQGMWKKGWRRSRFRDEMGLSFTTGVEFRIPSHATGDHEDW